MSAIVFRHVEWVDPHGSALSPLEIDILFEVVEPGLMQDVNFKMLYIAAKPGQTLPGFTATDEDDGIVISQEDVVLDEVDAGPLEKVRAHRVTLLHRGTSHMLWGRTDRDQVCPEHRCCSS